MPELSRQIESPFADQMDDLCEWLSAQSETVANGNDWPANQLQRCAEFGVFRWFVPRGLGGFGWNPAKIAEGYLRIGSSCLTTTFVITQWYASVKRILSSGNEQLKLRLIPDLLTGATHTTVGLSHLTTSHRHLAKPVLAASPYENGFELNGFSPWVTAGPFADFILVGATLDTDDQVLLIVPTDSPGVSIDPTQSLVALSASRTGTVRFDHVQVGTENLVAGPASAVLANKQTSGSGGIQTSSLALALSRAAIDFIQQQSVKRPELAGKVEVLGKQWQDSRDDLMAMAEGVSDCTNEDLRTRANSLALRTTQAAMVAAKGAGFVEGHPVGRWCREALFFLVWSCPPTVLEANLCELAGIQS